MVEIYDETEEEMKKNAMSWKKKFDLTNDDFAVFIYCFYWQARNYGLMIEDIDKRLRRLENERE